MKKILLILSVLFVSGISANIVLAQQVPTGSYYLSAKMVLVQNGTNNDMRNITLKVTVDNGTQPLLEYETGVLDGKKSARNLPKDGVLLHPTRPSKLVFYSERRWRTWSFGWHSHSTSLTTSFNIDPSIPFIDSPPRTLTKADNGGDIMEHCNTTFQFMMIPNEILFYNKLNQRIATSELSWGSDLVIKTTKNYHEKVYDWEYYVGDAYDTPGAVWRDFPTHVLNVEKDEITFKGSDIFNSMDEFRNLFPGKKIFVRINAPTKKDRQFLILTPNLTAPHFLPVQSAGFDSFGKANVKLSFDRPLFEGERIEIFGTDDVRITSRESYQGANYIILSGLDPGIYRFHVKSFLPDPTGGGEDEYDLYDEDETHWVEYEVKAPRAIEPWLKSHSNVSVYGGHDGKIIIGASGGTGNYIAEIFKDGETSSVQQISFSEGQDCVFSDLYTGVYEVVVSDTQSLVSSTLNPPVTITEPAPPVISINISQRNVSFWGGNDGAITVSVSGGSGNGYTAELYEGGSSYPMRQITLNGSGVFSGLLPGDYRVVVTDDIGGSSNRYITITEPPMPVVDHAVAIRDVSCYGGSDGQITVTASGGSGSFIARLYEIGGAAPLEQITFLLGQNGVFSGLSAGDYQVRVTDSNGITSNNPEISVVVFEPDEPVAVSVEEMIEPLAFESHDGEIVLKVTGGTPTDSGEYDVELSDEDDITYSPSSSFRDDFGDLFYRFEGIGKGDYSVIVRDANYNSLTPEHQAAPCSCEAIITFTMNAPPPLVVEIEQTLPITWFGAANGELTAHATGGVPLLSNMRYTYTWYKREEGVMEPLQMPSDSVARNLPAGVYQVKITDKNGISKTSVSYNLEEPDQLTVQFTIVQTDCSGANTGSIEAFVRGGVPPYQYQWNVEGASENILTSLEAGTYMLKVTDAYGGILTSTVDVGSSSDLKVEQTVTQPTCLTPNGSIQLKLSGAAPPYKIHWNDMAESESIDPDTLISREDLPAGTYRVEVVDANGCRNSYSFTIDELKIFTVSLGKDITMNRGQSRTIKAECDEPDVVFEWFFNGVKLPDTGNSIVVDQAGEYSVSASTEEGCMAVDQMEVKITEDVLELKMTVPTTIEVGSQVHAVNLSTMPADRIEWLLPDDVVIIEQSDTRLVFRIDREGVYTIAMEGFKGEGASLVTREIQVVGKGTVQLPDAPLIKQFWVAPNPSTGYFKVVVELSRAEDFTMYLYSPSGALMDTKEGHGVESGSFEYEIAGTQQGTYLLHLETKTDKSALQIVIKR